MSLLLMSVVSALQLIASAAYAQVPPVCGDVVADGRINMTDAAGLLGHLFRSGPAPQCSKAADANDDGETNLSDAVSILGHLFLGRGELPAPFGRCGDDPTEDRLDCESYPLCRP